MTSVAYSAAKVVPITPFLLGNQRGNKVLIKGLQLPRWGTPQGTPPSGRESPAFTFTKTTRYIETSKQHAPNEHQIEQRSLNGPIAAALHFIVQLMARAAWVRWFVLLHYKGFRFGVLESPNLDGLSSDRTRRLGVGSLADSHIPKTCQQKEAC